MLLLLLSVFLLLRMLLLLLMMCLIFVNVEVVNVIVDIVGAVNVDVFIGVAVVDVITAVVVYVALFVEKLISVKEIRLDNFDSSNEVL
jgi:hypothetical protein